MKSVYEIKSIAAEVTDIDEQTGVIKGYFSVFGNVDSDKDMVMPGAFKTSLKQNYDRIKHLYQHDPLRPLSSTRGGSLKLAEDSKGLSYESKVSQTSWGKDVIQLHMDGVIDENSIGYSTIKSMDKKSYRELHELKLWEGSSVTWGANELAQTSKSLFGSPEMITKKMDSVMKALRSGKYEHEEIFDSLEIYLKQLEQLVINKSSQSETQVSINPVISQLQQLNSLFK